MGLHKLKNASLDKRKLISWKSKLTEDPQKTRLIGLSVNSRVKSLLVKFSLTMRWLILSPSLEVKEPKVLSRDSVSQDSQERLEEVSERSLVSVPGIRLLLSGLLLELVTSVTTTELTLTTKFTELDKVQLEELTTTPLPKLMLTPKTLLQLVDSLITVSLMKISFLLEVEFVDQERDKSLSERLFFHKPPHMPTLSLRSNLSIPLPRLVTVNSRPQKRKINSLDHPLPKLPKSD